MANQKLIPYPREEFVVHRLVAGVDPLACSPDEWPRHFGPSVTSMYRMHTDEPSPEQSAIYFFGTDTHLGVALRFDLPPGLEADALSVVKAMGLMLSPGADRKATVYLEIDPNGKQAQMYGGAGTPYYPYRWEFRTHCGDGWWAGLFWLAYEDIGVVPEAGDVWSVNVLRPEVPETAVSAGSSRGGPKNVGGYGLAPRFDSVIFAEECCRLRFGAASPLAGVMLDTSRPGIARVRFAVTATDRFDSIVVRLKPCVGDAVDVTAAPAAQCRCEFRHRIADRVQCDLQFTGIAGGRRTDLGLYRFHTPTVVRMSMDGPSHRYGPNDTVARVSIRSEYSGVTVESLELHRQEDDETKLVRTVPVAGEAETVVPIGDLPVGAYVLRGRTLNECVVPECMFNRTATQPPAIRQDSRFRMSETVDFPDDLSWNWFDRDDFDEYFDFFCNMGVRRVYWMDYGSPADSDIYNVAPGAPVSYHKTAHETFRRVGDYLNMAVAAAKKRQMEFFGTLKPFESGIEELHSAMHPTGLTEAQAEAAGCFVLKGSTAEFSYSRREDLQRYSGMFSKYRNWQPPPDTAIAEVRLYHIDDKSVGIRPADLRFWVSNNNREYEPLATAYESEEKIVERDGCRCRCFAFRGLDIRHRFVALTCNRFGATFINRASRLAEALDSAGRSIEVTLGFQTNWPVVEKTPELQRVWPPREEELPYFRGPIPFGKYWSPGWPGQFPDDGIRALDAEGYLVAVAMVRGKDRQIMIPDPSEPDGMAYLLERVRRLIRAGVDGVHFRIKCHHYCMDMPLYGCNDAVVKAYRERHGVDITQTLPDTQKFADICGDFYTEFLRCSRTLTDRAGVQVVMGVPDSHGFMTALPLTLQWQRWIHLGLTDGILLKEMIPPNSTVCQALRVLTRRHGMELYQNPSNLDHRDCRRLLPRAYADGCDGYNLYEALCYLVRNDEQGKHPRGAAVRNRFIEGLRNGEYARDRSVMRLARGWPDADKMHWLVRIAEADLRQIRKFAKKARAMP